MKIRTTLSRRDFIKLNVLIGGSLILSVPMPSIAATATNTPQNTAETALSITRLRPLYGTPTDIAISRQADVWAIIDAEHVLWFNRSQLIWEIDETVVSSAFVAGENPALSFPRGSCLSLARWGRPNSSNQQLLVLGPVFHVAEQRLSN